MCGRYARTQRDDDLVEAFEVERVVGEELPASFNIAPTQDARAVLTRPPQEDPQGPAVRQLRTLRWGLVPSWAKDVKIGNKMVNARIETVLEKPSYKRAATRRRLVVPATGYYEWAKGEDGKKQPYFMHDPDGGVLAFAGLYELRADDTLPEDHPEKWLWTFTIITTRAGDALGHIHDRTPLVLPASFVDDWLDPAFTDPDDVRQLLDAVPEPHLHPYEVSTAVNSVRNNRPDLLEPLD